MQEIQYYNDLVMQFEDALARDLTKEERLFLYQIARAHHSVHGISKQDHAGKWDQLFSFLLTR